MNIELFVSPEGDIIERPKPVLREPRMFWQDCSVCLGSGVSGDLIDRVDGTGCWHCGGRGWYWMPEEAWMPV